MTASQVIGRPVCKGMSKVRFITFLKSSARIALEGKYSLGILRAATSLGVITLPFLRF